MTEKNTPTLMTPEGSEQELILIAPNEQVAKIAREHGSFRNLTNTEARDLLNRISDLHEQEVTITQDAEATILSAKSIISQHRKTGKDLGLLLETLKPAIKKTSKKLGLKKQVLGEQSPKEPTPEEQEQPPEQELQEKEPKRAMKRQKKTRKTRTAKRKKPSTLTLKDGKLTVTSEEE